MYQLFRKVKSLSRVRLFATPWAIAYQDTPSMGFSRQEYWSGVPLPSPSSSEYLLVIFCTLVHKSGIPSLSSTQSSSCIPCPITIASLNRPSVSESLSTCFIMSALLNNYVLYIKLSVFLLPPSLFS